ncbi:MAG: hypothetical protein ABSF67_24540 [Roseiarcus sp.]|jgi:hypothetical protein
MSKCAIVLMSSLALAGCGNPALFAPMEPTRALLAAARRSLSDTEKDAISAAVMGKLGEQPRRDFEWLPLVVRTHGRVIDYCGLVSGAYVVGEYDIHDANAELRDFYAQLTFDGRGKLSNVNVVAIGKSRRESIPTMVDSICIQGGYNISQ